MILLKVIPNGPYIDPRFLDASDVPFVILVIVCLFIAFFKLKKQRSNTLTDVHTIEKYSAENCDILMQPKTIDHDGSTLFGDFSLRNMYKGLLLLVTVILVILSVKYGIISNY